jgi:SAM-dependent methyltransferase
MRPEEFTAMLDVDEVHWWYRARREIVNAVLDGLALPAEARILDAGSGSGRTLDELARRGPVSGLDASPAGVEAARRRGHADVHVGRVEELPWADGTFDLVTCLDVVEHTPDDRRTLAELRRVTAPGGVLVVTVPALPSLWSTHDEMNQHYRRYTRRTLREAAAGVGWQPVRDTFFNTILLPPGALVRWAQRLRPGAASGRSDVELTPTRLNAVLQWPMRLEAALIRHGRRLPVGMSLLATFRNSQGPP